MATRIILAGLGVAAIAGFGIFTGFSLSETASNIRVSLASVPQIQQISALAGGLFYSFLSLQSIGMCS
jgi:hypothetical protein